MQVKKLQAPQKQAEPTKKPKGPPKASTPSEPKPVRAPKKPRREAAMQDPEIALRLKVISMLPKRWTQHAASHDCCPPIG